MFLKRESLEKELSSDLLLNLSDLNPNLFFPLLFLKREFFLLTLPIFLKSLNSNFAFGFISLCISLHICLSFGVRNVKAEPSAPALAVLPIR